MMLYFNPQSIPRSTTKAQWREMWQWKRKVEFRLKAEMDKQMENLILFGSTHPEIAADIADKIINPPILLNPWQK